MKLKMLSVLATVALSSLASAADGWTSMFNGKDLSGWKSNTATENQPEGVFSVKDGELVVNGGRAHLFYVGEDGKAKFKNFEFKAKVKTTPGSNSGIYFHTKYRGQGLAGRGLRVPGERHPHRRQENRRTLCRRRRDGQRALTRMANGLTTRSRSMAITS